LRVFVPLQLHAQTAHAAIFGQAIALRTHVVCEKVGIADDPLRKAGFIGGLLHVGHFVLEAILGPIGLHIDRPGHAAAGDVGKILADRIVAADRFIRSEDARLHRSVEPRQIGPPPDVVMCVDNCRHGFHL
jgi:hypothetical protein